MGFGYLHHQISSDDRAPCLNVAKDAVDDHVEEFPIHPINKIHRCKIMACVAACAVMATIACVMMQ
jgi:hypothetical protein